MFKLSKRSLTRLKGVDGDLVRVVKRAIQITPIDFGVTEGLRTEEQQAYYVASGKSQTMKSRHLIGQAVDLVAYVDGKVTWEQKHYYTIADAMKMAAEELGVKITWGGDWKTLFDGVHFQVEV